MSQRNDSYKSIYDNKVFLDVDQKKPSSPLEEKILIHWK